VSLQTACACLTGFLGLYGAIFFSFGMFFIWESGFQLHPIDEWRLSRSYAKAPALIESVKVIESNENEGNNEAKVYEYNFHFQPGDGPSVKGTCYTTGQTWQEGDRVEVHYLPENPEVARIEGTRLSFDSPWGIFFLPIFPTVGLCLFLFPLVAGVKKMKLLRYGEITGAIKISSALTGASIGDEKVIKYSYEFRDRLGNLYTGYSKALRGENIGDETSEPILYLPSNPHQSMLVDALSLKYPLEIDEKGNWYHRGSVIPIFVFLLSCFLILIHAAIAFIILIN
jgi:hypothetical protein